MVSNYRCLDLLIRHESAAGHAVRYELLNCPIQTAFSIFRRFIFPVSVWTAIGVLIVAALLSFDDTNTMSFTNLLSAQIADR